MCSRRSVGGIRALQLASTRRSFNNKPTRGVPVQLTFLGSVTPVMHAFWDVDEDAMKQSETIQFFKNLMLVGALLFYLGMKRV